MATPPNIVFILADDLGYGDFSSINQGLSHTPVLDQLMAEGTCLTQQYTASPVCNPSRACLLTGRYPHRTGSIDTLEWRGLERLALRETTLAEVLQSSGYRTGLVGKWHLGAFDDRYRPQNRGFDDAVCFRGGMHDYYQWRIEFGDTVRRGDGRYLTDVWTEEACQFIRRNQSDPFFLHVTYNAPHTPLQAPEEAIQPFREKGQFNEGVSTLYGMIECMDRGVGQILETLRSCGLEENTLVCFTSDNGPQFGGKHSLDRFNCQLHGAKGAVYEGGIRVPMILRWPSGLEGGRQLDAMVHFSDWFPTLLSMADLEPPRGLSLDGVDVSSILQGEGGNPCEKHYWQWNRYTPRVESNAAARDGPWKLVCPAMTEAMEVFCADPWLQVSMYEPERLEEAGLLPDPWPCPDLPEPPPPELYNLEMDPTESNNLADDHPDIAHRLLVQLENWFESVEKDRATIDDVW